MHRQMMNALAGLTFLAAALLAITPAQAATVTNRDAKEYKLTILEGDKAQHHVLKPSAVLPDLCPKGCIVRLNDSENDEYELEGTEIVSIEDGYLYYDVPDAVPGPAPGQGPGQGAAPSPSPAPTPAPGGEPKKN
jgi:hypothetical protein